MEPVEKIRRTRGAKLRLHRRLTLKGLYAREQLGRMFGGTKTPPDAQKNADLFPTQEKGRVLDEKA